MPAAMLFQCLAPALSIASILELEVETSVASEDASAAVAATTPCATAEGSIAAGTAGVAAGTEAMLPEE
jgi:hypothetical protein